MNELQGSIVALVTPFRNDKSIDFHALEKLVTFQLESGTNGILVNGTTGESPSIALEEFDSITKFVVDKVDGAIPVIAGTGSNSTSQAIEKSIISEANGVDGLLVVSPYYNKPTDKGLENYFGTIAEAVELPIIMYNVPGRTSKGMSVDLMLRIAERYKNVIGVKEASGSMDRIMELVNRSSEDFAVYSGDDSLALNTVLMGGDGCISVVANEIPKVFSQMLRAGLNGDLEIARSLHYKYFDLMSQNFIETNPIPVKTALHAMGLINLVFRSPMCEMEEETAEVFLTELTRVGLIQGEDYAGKGEKLFVGSLVDLGSVLQTKV